MQKLIYTLLISTFLILFSACRNEEPIQGICENVVCENGGVCDEQGNCNCPPEFEGTNCENLASPKEIKINKITVTSFNETNDGSVAWDELSGPDLYVVFSKIDVSVPIDETEVIEDAEFGMTYEFPVEWSMDVEPDYYFYLLDEDDDTQSDSIIIVGDTDWMGELVIHPMDFRESKPAVIDLAPQLNDGFGVRLEVEWVFE